jgi:hypothetical protein
VYFQNMFQLYRKKPVLVLQDQDQVRMHIVVLVHQDLLFDLKREYHHLMPIDKDVDIISEL